MTQERAVATERETLDRSRIVAGAVRQSAAHRWAAEACLHESDGSTASLTLRDLTLARRASYHAERARTCVAIATRVNRDEHMGPIVALLLKDCEKLLLRVGSWLDRVHSKVDEDFDAFEVEVVRHLA